MDYSSEANKIFVNEVWYGLINDDWKYKKIKYVFDERKETNNPIKTEELISLTMEDGVVPHSMKTGSGGNKPKDDLSKYKVVHPGDIVINPMNVIVGSVGLSKYYGVLSPVYITLTPKEDSGKVEFYDYLFSTELFQKSLMGMGNGILIRESESSGKLNTIRMRIPMEKLGNHFLPIPPREEQKQIVDFLDKKTTQIEKLIKKIEQKIELLKKQRNSIIDEVVTQGLNPNVEKKESGVEWIGEIPSHWKISKLKYLVSENQESLSSSTDPDLELDYIEISDVNSIGEFKKPTKYIFSESPSRCRRICRKGDVIISTVRTYLKSIGIIEEQRENLICSTGFSVLTPKSQYLSKYVFYMLRSNWFISKIISRSEGVSYPSIQSHKLLGTDVIIMDKQEQQKIVEFLDEETQKIDKTIYKEEKRIELLKEYKQSLISEVVTGKKRVV